jgi:DNA-binding transcriptional LysR family regulator
MADLEALRALLALREEGNLTAAARTLAWPKSTLSRRLAALEAELGQPLTRQDTGRLAVNDAGTCYAGYAERILALAEEARRSVAALSQEMLGSVRVWIDPAFAQGWATRTLNEFLAEHPRVHMAVSVLPPAGLPPAGATDLWLACDTRTLPELRRTPLGRWHRRVYTAAAPHGPCCRLDHPHAISACTWIGLAADTGPVVLEHAERGERHSLEPPARLRLDSVAMLADAIARGYGIGILPSWLAECPRHGHRGRFARVLEDWQAPPIELSYHVPRGARPRRIDVLVDYLRARLPPRWALPPATTGT